MLHVSCSLWARLLHFFRRKRLISLCHFLLVCRSQRWGRKKRPTFVVLTRGCLTDPTTMTASTRDHGCTTTTTTKIIRCSAWQYYCSQYGLSFRTVITVTYEKSQSTLRATTNSYERALWDTNWIQYQYLGDDWTWLASTVLHISSSLLWHRCYSAKEHKIHRIVHSAPEDWDTVRMICTVNWDQCHKAGF